MLGGYSRVKLNSIPVPCLLIARLHPNMQLHPVMARRLQDLEISSRAQCDV